MSSGRPAGSYTQTERVLGIIAMMIREPCVTVDQICTDFGVTRRTCNRDLNAIQAAHIPIVDMYDPDNRRRKYWRLVPNDSIERVYA